MNYRKIEPNELQQILKDHALWLADNTKGNRANLSSADLRWADLRSANLRWADLRSANLRWANLSSADLRWADLRSANLSSADLRSANLSSADLRWADLSSADLRWADLSSADLRWANLLVFQHNRHTAYFTIDGSLRIGCHAFDIKIWAKDYKKIGKQEGYTKSEIESYGMFIKICQKALKQAKKDKK